MQHTTAQKTETTKGKKQLTPPPAPSVRKECIKPCDKNWLQQLAFHYPAIADALSYCTHCWWDDDQYVYLICSGYEKGPYGQGMILTSATHGTIVVDMYASGLIAGIEFLDNVLGYTMNPDSFSG